MSTPRPISEPVDRRILATDQVDQLGEALLNLTREVWTLTDRVRVLEAVLDAKGLDVHGAVEVFQPAEALQRELDSMRARLLASVTGPLVRN